ncbi:MULTISPECIES: hypothetical protein [unclassified Pseudoalteromonas]|uniref:hypothetical protein n=1 Tax=unclassified Pseudoalteromonas TaxID=194690 RepID=UPI000CF602EB|nr:MULTISPECIES: hypothetical protein [unclassified Pseudoalteromonas]TMO26990.1 hypothetical protein CWC28_12230 [Pseudoalteromonas sp. S4492]
MSKKQHLFIALTLLFAGALSTSLISKPLIEIINFISALGGGISGVCALYALLIWRKQINYSKKLEVLEALEKVHITCGSLTSIGNDVYSLLYSSNNIENGETKKYYAKLSSLYFDKVETLKMLNVEFLTKARMLEVIMKSNELRTLKNDVVSSTNQYINFKLPIDLKREKSVFLLINELTHSLSNRNNEVCANYRNYITPQ